MPTPSISRSTTRPISSRSNWRKKRLWRSKALGPEPHPVITDRQRDCLVWVARGKSDWEISRIIGISPETVVRHVKQARERYGVEKRTSLLIRTLFDGTISFTDIFRR